MDVSIQKSECGHEQASPTLPRPKLGPLLALTSTCGNGSLSQSHILSRRSELSDILDIRERLCAAQRMTGFGLAKIARDHIGMLQTEAT
jgi:hypothetical protein